MITIQEDKLLHDGAEIASFTLQGVVLHTGGLTAAQREEIKSVLAAASKPFSAFAALEITPVPVLMPDATVHTSSGGHEGPAASVSTPSTFPPAAHHQQPPQQDPAKGTKDPTWRAWKTKHLP